MNIKTILTIIIIGLVVITIIPADKIENIPGATEFQVFIKEQVSQRFNKTLNWIKDTAGGIIEDTFNIIESRVQEGVTDQLDSIESDVQDTITDL